MASLRASLCAVSLALAACDGGPPKPGTADAGTTDAAPDQATVDAPGADIRVDVAGDLSPDLAPLPPAALRLVLPGKARLAGNGSGSCTNGVQTVPTDTWCAFTRTIDAADAGATTELWVINATRVAAGESVPCDGSSLQCRRLHRELWTGGALGGPSFPYDDLFEGDTLIFYAGGIAMKPDGIYQGPVWAWRPGWAEARVISSDKGLFCFGHARAAVAFCVENVFQGPPVQFDLRAGMLVDGPASQFPLIATGVRPWNGNEIAWHAEFSPDASQFAISVQEPSTEGEVLHVGSTADLGKKALREIAYQATYWRISLDGKKIYYLQDFNGTPYPTGKLVMADFPSGGNAVLLQSGVARFLLLGEPGEIDRGVGFFQDMVAGHGTFRVIADRNHPSQVTTVAEQVEDVGPSPDGRFVLYAKLDPQGLEQMHLARTDGKGTCMINAPDTEAFGLHFLENSELVFWSELNGNVADAAPVGWVARTDGCAGKQRYAERIDFVTTVKDRIAITAYTPKDTYRYVLEYSVIGTGTPALTAPKLIRDQTDGIIGAVSDQRGTTLLLQVPDGPPETQGVYMYGPLAH